MAGGSIVGVDMRVTCGPGVLWPVLVLGGLAGELDAGVVADTDPGVPGGPGAGGPVSGRRCQPVVDGTG